MQVVAYPVTVPSGVTRGDWVHYVTACILYDLELISDCLSRVCSPIMCRQIESSMAKYSWVDTDGKTSRLSSTTYANNVLKYGQELLKNHTLFETRSAELQTLYRRVYRIFAHAISCHNEQLQRYNLLPTINSYYTSFTAFATFHGLLPEQEIFAGGMQP